MNIKNHVYERYVERILYIKDPQEIKQYIAINQLQLTSNIEKMFENSKFIWQGVVSKKNNTTAKFYISDNIIIVTDTACSCIQTLYRVDFGFPEHINRQTLKGLMDELEKLNMLLEEENQNINDFLAQKEVESDNLGNEIVNLTRQLEIKKAQKEFVKNEIINKRSDAEYIRKDIDKYAFMLCNSLEFKKDFAEV